MGRSGSTHSLVNFSLGNSVGWCTFSGGFIWLAVFVWFRIAAWSLRWLFSWHSGDLVELHGSCGTFGARHYFSFHQEVAQFEFWELVSRLNAMRLFAGCTILRGCPMTSSL